MGDDEDPFSMEDEVMDPDLEDGDDFPNSDDLPSPARFQGDQGAEPDRGAMLRNPSRMEILGLSSGDQGGAPVQRGAAEWQGEQRPTVADLDAMGWFNEDSDYFDGPAAPPGAACPPVTCCRVGVAGGTARTCTQGHGSVRDCLPHTHEGHKALCGPRRWKL